MFLSDMSASGRSSSCSSRSSSCSIVQEENVVKRMHKTPGTPIKTGYQTTPRKSDSKRSLFQSNSPSNSDDLGLISPLSLSSCYSAQSLDSPQFSPNGKFTTPPRTPPNGNIPVRISPKLSSLKLNVKSSLFPDLKLSTPKSRRIPRTARILVPKVLATKERLSPSDEVEEGIRSLTTPPSSSRKMPRKRIFSNMIISESDTSPSVDTLTPQNNESSSGSGKLTKLGIEPLSCESFYGYAPKPDKACTRLFIDTLEPRSAPNPLVHSLSKESLTSNRSFVSGGTHKKIKSNRTSQSRSSKSDRRRAPHVGVWHNIKKPKKIKKIKTEKPLISPKSRLGKMLESPKKKDIKVKSKRLFQENPRRRIAHGRKRSRNESDDDIIDSFPDHLIKRNKLPGGHYNVHPAISKLKVDSPEDTTPDPNKKFLKYGQRRKATFTLNENVKLQISDGVMKLQSPKKRRKLYSAKKDIIEDFNDFEEEDCGIEQSIQGILNRLQSHTEITPAQKVQLTSPSKVQVEKISDMQLINILDSPSTRVKVIKATPTKIITKVHRSPLKAVSNLSAIILNDFDCDDENNINVMETTNEKESPEVSLEKTGNMVSLMTNILFNNDQDIESLTTTNMEGGEEETENLPPNDKYFSLFYKQNWKKSLNTNDDTNGKFHSNKKKILVPDDQYLLDAGQKSIGIITCKKCGVMYQAGDYADEATHNNFHNHLPELRFSGWNNERVVGKYLDGRVVMIKNTDSKIWWQKVSKIVEIVDQELGFPEASMPSLFYKTAYLYINEKSKQIAGCLIAEECKVAYKMFPPLEGIEIDSCSKDPTPCKVGISRIWTALSNRRKGVASRMIDCLQRTFFFGEIIPIDQVAFSVPSPPGKLLAQKVTGRFDFLVYGFP